MVGWAKNGMMALLAWSLAGLAAAQGLHFATEPHVPFAWEEGGKARGPAVEVVMAACDVVRMTCQIDVLPWRRGYGLAEEGKLDGIFLLLPTPEREKIFYFSHPVVHTSLNFFVHKDSSWVYHSPVDLSGMTLVAYGPSGASSLLAELVAQNPDARMEIELNNVHSFRKLQSGRYGPHAAVLANRDGGMELLKRRNIQDIKMAGQVKAISYVLGLSRKTVAPDQVARLNQALQTVQQNGKARAIFAKYHLQDGAMP